MKTTAGMESTVRIKISDIKREFKVHKGLLDLEIFVDDDVVIKYPSDKFKENSKW